MAETVNAKGLACPQPVILAMRALKKEDRIVVIVDNDTAVENVTRLGKSSGCDVVSEKKSDGTYEIRLEKKADAAPTTDDQGIVRAGQTDVSGPFTIVFAENKMGRGDDELGAVLIRAFIHTITEQDVKPDMMIFYNTGVKLATQDSEVFDDLKNLAAAGVEMLVCGTCANFFNIKDQIAVGLISNMYDIAGAMSRAGRLVVP